MKFYILAFIFVLLISFGVFLKQNNSFVMCDFPYCKENVVINTIDDIHLTQKEIKRVDALVKFYDDLNVPTTYFVIPHDISLHYDFPKSAEVADHGLTHINPIDGSFCEFGNLDRKTIKKRLIKAKNIFKKYGYEVKGFRAPSYCFEEGNLDILKELFEYDSTFRHKIDAFTYPNIRIDLLKYIVIKDENTRELIDDRNIAGKKENIRKKIELFNKEKQPLVLISHYWDYVYIINTEDGNAYLKDLFKMFKDYPKMNLIEYVEWEKRKNNLKITYHLFGVELSDCLEGLGFYKKNVLNCNYICYKNYCYITGDK